MRAITDFPLTADTKKGTNIPSALHSLRMGALKRSRTFPRTFFILPIMGFLRYHLNIAIFFMVDALFRFIFRKGGTTYGHFRHNVGERILSNDGIERDLGFQNKS